MIAKGTERRLSFVVAVTAAPLMAAVRKERPASAQTVVTRRSTFTLRNDDTGTLVQTCVDGVQTATSYTEATPAGFVVLQRDTAYYLTGVISSTTEVRTSTSAYQTTTVTQYDESGVIRQQHVTIVSAGQTIAEQFATFDAAGYLLTQETRTLTTQPDASQGWDVTTETWSSGVLVTSTTTQYPYGYDFNAVPVVNTPPVVDTPPVVSTPPVVDTPPVVSTPPVVDTPPAVVQPPVVQPRPVVDTPPVVSTPPVVDTPPVVSTPPALDTPP